MKICLCFFGVVSRSIHLTKDSIQHNIFDVIQKRGHTYEVYVHDIKVKDLESPRAGDSVKNLEDRSNHLPCDYYESSKQEDIDEYLFTQNAYGIPNTREPSAKNMYRQLFSLQKVTKMWQNENKFYDYYVYLRPDLEYMQPLPMEMIEKYQNTNYLLTPSWGAWDGLNDRIYMGAKDVIFHFGNRIEYLALLIFDPKRKYQPERYMKIVSDHFKIPRVSIGFFARRIRTNGTIPSNDRR